MESLVLPMTIHELSILARGIHGAFVAWAAWKEWSHESHMHCKAGLCKDWDPNRAPRNSLGMAKACWIHLDVAWIDLTEAFRIILAYAKLAGSWVCPKMTDGPILQQFSWGPQGPKNATDRILRLGVQARVAAATSGFLIFFNTSSNAARFLSSAKDSKKDQTVFRKTVRTNRYYSSRTCFLNSRPYLNSFSDWFWHVSMDSEGRKIPLAIGLAGNWVLVI